MQFLLKTLVFTLLTTALAHAKVVPQASASFPIEAEKLLAGEVHVFVDIVSAQSFMQRHANLVDLDALRAVEREGALLIVRKSAYMVDKPAGFFNDRQLTQERWLKHLSPGEKFKKGAENSFQVTADDGRYKLEIYIDSDDLSDIQQPRLMRAVGLTKRLDPLSGGSFASECQLRTGTKEKEQSQLRIINYVSHSARKTVVISYELTSVARSRNKDELKKVREDLIKEVPTLVQRTNSYQ